MQSSNNKQRFTGSCHCGSVQFQIDSDLSEVTTCNCSMCRRRNAVMLKVHESDFVLLDGAEVLSKYQFHNHTAQHFFCSQCGIYPFHRKRMAPDSYGINTQCLEGFDAEGIPARETNGIELP